MEQGECVARMNGWLDFVRSNEAIRRVPVKKYLDHSEDAMRIMDACTTKGPPGKEPHGKSANQLARPLRKKL